VGLTDGAPAHELDPGLERRKRGRTRYSQKEREQSCDAHQMDFFAGIEEDSSIRRARRRYEQEDTGTRPSSSLHRASCSARNLCG
jgi:hypothetical protein